MRIPIRFRLIGLLLPMLVAAVLPIAAAGQAAADPEPAPVPEATCRVPQAGDPAPVRPGPDLASVRAQAAAQAAQAHTDGFRPLNTRGYNYDTGHGGLDPAALDFEVRAR